jgi:hypothetical protein
MTPRERLAAYEDFPRFLRRLLASRSTRQVALRTGLDHATVARLARGHRDPHLATAKAVIDAYGSW